MANVGLAATQGQAYGAGRREGARTTGFDWTATALSAGLVGGAYLDAWAHERGHVDDSFFTPWHGILYSAMLLVAVFLSATFLNNIRRGAAWRRALPAGYGLSLVGTLVFAVGGAGDMIWHILFGVENNLEALLSPTHLILALGWILIVGGPLRAAWQRPDEVGEGWLEQMPRYLSLAFILSVFTFFTTYANPFGHALAANSELDRGEAWQALGVAAILVQTALLTGVALFAARRWRLPVGALTVVVTLNTALMSVLHDLYVLIPFAAAGGVLADILYQTLRPGLDRLVEFRVWSFATPAALYALYFAALLVTGGIWWSIHLWAGAIVLAGVVGLLLSYLALPPVVRNDSA